MSAANTWPSLPPYPVPIDPREAETDPDPSREVSP